MRKNSHVYLTSASADPILLESANLFAQRERYSHFDMSSIRRPLHGKLSRRESQIMNAVYRRGRATAKEIRASLPDPPTNSSVRVLLRILEEKGHLKHERDGRRYVSSGDNPVVV